MSDFVTALKNAINHWDQQHKEEPMQTTTIAEQPQPQPAQNAEAPRKVARVTMPDGRSVFAPTNNVTRETFDFVKANPGLTTAQIAKALAARGFKESSVTSIVSQMVRAKMAHRDEDSRVFATRTKYRPIESSAAKQLQRQQAKARTAGKRAAMQQIKEQAVEAPPKQTKEIKEIKEVRVRTLEMRSDMNETQFVEAILSNISIFGARVLYDKLKPLFDK